MNIFIRVVSVVLAAIVFLPVTSADPAPAGSAATVLERTAKFGQVCVEGQACATEEEAPVLLAAAGMSGEEVYTKFCFVCHAQGIAGAPKLGDDAAWAERMDKGMDAIRANTINGINTMPPKGTCMQCSDEELIAAVDYMLEN